MRQPIYIIDGARSPFLKARHQPGPFSAADLAMQPGRALLMRQRFMPDQLDEVILGCASPSVDEVNIGRVVALRMGCGHRVPGWTVMRNCASGMQAIDSAAANLLSGRSHLVLAGGVDALSRAPLLYNHRMVNWFARMAQARGPLQKAQALLRLQPQQAFKPIVSLMRGLTDPSVGLMMGQTAENLAYRFGIHRKAMDTYALQSHARAAAAQEAGRLKTGGGEIEALYTLDGQTFTADNGVRRELQLEQLAALPPFFDRHVGNITAGNSSQITDGAAWLLLADRHAVKNHQLTPIGRIVDVHWAGLDPAQMGLGPVHAATPMLVRHGLTLNDIDAWEINEAFAAQVLGCLAAWRDETYCQTQLGLTQAFGEIDPEKLNVDGGAIALGHPVGASGTRIVLHLLHVLKRTGGKRGVAAICIGGGLGGAMLIEAL